MIVILEGPDGGGKTTLARHLEQAYGFRYVHTGPPTSDKVLEAYGRTLYDASQEPRSTVIDRLHIGERIYGPALRGSDLLTRNGEVLLHRLISAYGARLVFCIPPYDTAVENWRKRHETEGAELIKKKLIYDQVYYAYKNLSQDFFYANSSWWDYTKVHVGLAAESLLKFNGTHTERCPEGVIGSPTAKFLFVGDVANQEYLDIPFFALNGSSEFLNSCIAEAGYQERDIALVNSRRLDLSIMPLGAIYVTLKSPKVIALGNAAASSLKSQGVTYTLVEHPSYWKRFHAGQRHEYVRKLRNIRIGTYQDNRERIS